MTGTTAAIQLEVMDPDNANKKEDPQVPSKIAFLPLPLKLYWAMYNTISTC